MACPCCATDEPRRPARQTSSERAQSGIESDKRYYAKVKDERRDIFRERRRRYYQANRDIICQKMREQRALAKESKEQTEAETGSETKV